MPHERTKAYISREIARPENWLSGEATMPLRAGLGVGQVLPKARDAINMLRRLQGGLSRVPTAGQRLFGPSGQYFQFHPQGLAWMEKEFKANNPIFRALQAQGMFD